MMQTVVRYSVVNQDGKPVIRAVPVRRRHEDQASRTAQPSTTTAQHNNQPHHDHLIRRLRRLRLRGQRQ